MVSGKLRSGHSEGITPHCRRSRMRALARYTLLDVVLICLGLSACNADQHLSARVVDLSRPDATHSIAIWMPPDPNGLTPSISLDYSSAASNGLMGVGWNFSVSRAIERCGRRIGQESKVAPIELSLEDRFCIYDDILRLEAGSSPYGTPNSQYVSALDDSMRITAHGTQGSGPRFFIIEARDGLTYEFGRTEDSRVLPGTSPLIATTALRWMLNKVSDRGGNSFAINYVNQDGFAFPVTVSWTPTSSGSGTYQNAAVFSYSGDRSESDSYKGQIAGYLVANRHRLEEIQIKTGSVVRRKYRFIYDTSASRSRSRLVALLECLDEAETNCSAPISFTY